MTRTTLPHNIHAAHTAGIIDHLTGAVTTTPEPGPRGSPTFAYRAGWLSAEKAMKTDAGQRNRREQCLTGFGCHRNIMMKSSR